MSQSRTRCLGMEVHQDALAVASVAQEHGAEVPSLGRMGTRQGAIDQMLRTRPATATPLLVRSDAGPCGSWLARSLTKPGDAGWVVAPSLLPQKPGDRVTTERRAAVHLARLARAGDRPAVSAPPVDEAALRALPRAREDPMRDLTEAPLRLTAVWLRHALRATGRAPGGPAHLRWLSAVVGPTPAQPRVGPAAVRAVPAPPARLPRLEPARRKPVHAWRLSPVGEALHAWRGVPCPGAGTLVAALGALTRCASPRALLQGLGLIPSD
jgi:hypothetical protein